jgi:hypothetical protein
MGCAKIEWQQVAARLCVAYGGEELHASRVMAKPLQRCAGAVGLMEALLQLQRLQSRGQW